MNLFIWSSDHSIYLPEIDAEHRALYRLGEELHQAVLAGAEPAQVRPVLLNLLESVEGHFRHEERLMRAMHYDATGWHKRQHDAVRRRAKEQLELIESGHPDAAMELLKFLSTWLRDHMSVADRMMGAYLRNYLLCNTALAAQAGRGPVVVRSLSASGARFTSV